MALAPGIRLGPHEVAGPLGAGGMGEVYRARDTRIGRDVAVKVLPPGFSQDPDRLRRFEAEARAAGALNHPNILALYDVGRHDGVPYVVTELLEGETLRERLGGSALHIRKAVEITVSMARGLAAAHDKGIVHRDLKPENVFLTRDGQVKILDFGLAKLNRPEPASGQDSALVTETRGTGPGTVLGTVGYMSPEQVRGRPVDHRSDIFSLGGARADGPPLPREEPRGALRLRAGPGLRPPGPVGHHDRAARGGPAAKAARFGPRPPRSSSPGS